MTETTKPVVTQADDVILEWPSFEQLSQEEVRKGDELVKRGDVLRICRHLVDALDNEPCGDVDYVQQNKAKAVMALDIRCAVALLPEAKYTRDIIVTDMDREASAELAYALGISCEDFTAGAADVLVQHLARHREAHSPSEPSVVTPPIEVDHEAVIIAGWSIGEAVSQDLVPDMFASGFMAAWVKMVADNGKAPFPLTDAEIDDAWRVWLEATNGR